MACGTDRRAQLQQFGTYLLGAFSLMLLVTLACMDYAPSARGRRRVLQQVFGPLAGVVIGAALTEVIPSGIRITSSKPSWCAAKSVAREAGVDMQLIDGDLEILARDDAAADEQMEVVRPLSSLPTAATETVYLHGSFDPVSKELTERLGDVLASLAVLNRRIELREMYRLTNRNVPAHQSRVGQLSSAATADHYGHRATLSRFDRLVYCSGESEVAETRRDCELQTVVSAAHRLCQSDYSVIFRQDGDEYRWAAGYGISAEYEERERRAVIRPGTGTVIGRAVLAGHTVQNADAKADPLYHGEAESDARGCSVYRSCAMGWQSAGSGWPGTGSSPSQTSK
jgi:hypothetical protein